MQAAGGLRLQFFFRGTYCFTTFHFFYPESMLACDGWRVGNRRQVINTDFLFFLFGLLNFSLHLDD